MELQGGIEHPDGRREPFAALVPTLAVRRRQPPAARRRARLHDGRRIGAADHGHRRWATPASTSAPASTSGFDGHWHGEWRGDLHVDGEHIADCTDVETAHRIHQIRDNLVRVDDPVGGGTGWGNLQSIVVGAHPEIGLTEEASFM